MLCILVYYDDMLSRSGFKKYSFISCGVQGALLFSDPPKADGKSPPKAGRLTRRKHSAGTPHRPAGRGGNTWEEKFLQTRKERADISPFCVLTQNNTGNNGLVKTMIYHCQQTVQCLYRNRTSLIFNTDIAP